MALAVSNAPRFSAADAVRIASEHFGVRAAAEPLPSERDQNFLLEWSGGSGVLKIANSGERREVLEYQNALIRRLAERCPGLRFPQIVGEIAAVGPYLARLLSWVDGTPLARVAPHTPEIGRASCRERGSFPVRA